MYSSAPQTSAPQTTQPIRVMLVDDQRLVRGGLSMLVNSQPDLQVVMEADDDWRQLTFLTAWCLRGRRRRSSSWMCACLTATA